MAFALEGDGAGVEEFAVSLLRGIVFGDVAAADLGMFVFEDGLAVDDVFDGLGTVDDDFGADPLVAVEGGGGGDEAVGGEEFAVAFDVGSGGAEVAGRARSLTEAAEELDFDGDGEILVFLHGGGGLAVDHDAAVAGGPAGAFDGLVGDEAVFDGDDVIRERSVVEEVAEAAGEFVVAVVADGEEAVFDTEGVGEVFADGVAGDLGGPAGEVLAVEEREPVFFIGWLVGLGEGGGGEEEEDRERFHDCEYIVMSVRRAGNEAAQAMDETNDEDSRGASEVDQPIALDKELPNGMVLIFGDDPPAAGMGLERLTSCVGLLVENVSSPQRICRDEEECLSQSTQGRLSPDYLGRQDFISAAASSRV